MWKLAPTITTFWGLRGRRDSIGTGPIGTGTCGVAARSKRAYQLTERAKSARAMEEKLSGYGETGQGIRPKAPGIQPYPSAP